MTTRKKTAEVAPIEADLAQMEAVITEAATMTAPTISRAVSEANRINLRINELERERQDFSDRRKFLRASFEAADAALASHETDIADTLTLLRGGIENPSNVVAMAAE